MPTINATAVDFGLRIGLALGSKLASRSVFHRKNYFYPDLPKGYQVSQFDEPLCDGGEREAGTHWRTPRTAKQMSARRAAIARTREGAKAALAAFNNWC